MQEVASQLTEMNNTNAMWNHHIQRLARAQNDNILMNYLAKTTVNWNG